MRGFPELVYSRTVQVAAIAFPNTYQMIFRARKHHWKEHGHSCEYSHFLHWKYLYKKYKFWQKIHISIVQKSIIIIFTKSCVMISHISSPLCPASFLIESLRTKNNF